MNADPGMVLVDTSVWIELLRSIDSPLRPEMDNLIGDDRARVCGVVMAELLQGATTAKDISAVEGLFQAIPGLKAEDRLWREAGKLGQRLRLKGAHVGLLDCYLASVALEHGCRLWSLDKHFSLIARHTDLRLLER